MDAKVPTRAGSVSVAVSPKSAALRLPNGTTSFTCTVTGSTNTACTWRVTRANGGTVTSAGSYTAPATAGTYHVVATSVADAGRDRFDAAS